MVRWLAVVVGLCGCRAPEPPPAGGSAPAAQSASQAASQAAISAAPALGDRPRPDGDDSVPLRALQRQLRYKHFRAQIPVAVPEALGPTLPALLPAEPADGFKVVAHELKRRMALSRPAPDRRQEMLRAVTRLEGLELREALKARLVAEGWAAAGAPLADRYSDPARGVLTLAVKVPEEQATVVEWVLDRKPADGPLTGAEALLAQAPPWLRAAGWPAAPTGYEFSRFHARGGGIRTTDVERLAVALPGAPGAHQAALEARVQAHGYTARADHPHSFKGPDGMTFASVIEGDSLVAVHQRRWRQPAPAAPMAPASGAAPASQR
ncbi:MAG: hypothetical protein H6702_05125 [Myxococcales bacterium]|nr:hypothetical protein [Myxococcales bacterium]